MGKITHIDEKLQEATVTDPWLELFGILCIFLGLIYGGIPQQVVSTIKALF